MQRLIQEESGLTLVELVVSMVIISIAISGTMLTAIQVSRGSADPQTQHQAALIAEAYLEEIMLKAVDDPDANDTEGTNRALFDDVDDYDGLNEAPTLQTGGLTESLLAGFQVQVAVDTGATAVLGNAGPGQVPGAPSGGATRIDITVTHPAFNLAYVLSGYRLDYEGP